jgi:DnaJ-class molecular chaperone
LPTAISDYYAALGLDCDCTSAQIRDAYRLLAKQFHPDVNASLAALAQTQILNAAYEILSDPRRRKEYDRELAASNKLFVPGEKILVNITKEIHLCLEEFLRGTTLEIRVNDPANTGVEIYELIVPPQTPPGARFKIPRHEPFERGSVLVRVKARADFRFKIRGSDLRCDLKINSQRALQGGVETVRGVMGKFLRVQIPKRVSRGGIIRIAGEGLPKPRGGRGDLLARILYTPPTQIRRNGHR